MELSLTHTLSLTETHKPDGEKVSLFNFTFALSAADPGNKVYGDPFGHDNYKAAPCLNNTMHAGKGAMRNPEYLCVCGGGGFESNPHPRKQNFTFLSNASVGTDKGHENVKISNPQLQMWQTWGAKKRGRGGNKSSPPPHTQTSVGGAAPPWVVTELQVEEATGQNPINPHLLIHDRFK